jgi:hypothetical protein
LLVQLVLIRKWLDHRAMLGHKAYRANAAFKASKGQSHLWAELALLLSPTHCRARMMWAATTWPGSTTSTVRMQTLTKALRAQPMARL